MDLVYRIDLFLVKHDQFQKPIKMIKEMSTSQILDNKKKF